MKQALFNTNRTIWVLIVIGASLLPLYAQQHSQADVFKTAAEPNQDGPCWVVPEDKRSHVRGFAIVKRAPVRRLSGLRWDLNKVGLDFSKNATGASAESMKTSNAARSLRSRSALSAGETPAVPGKRLTRDTALDAHQDNQTSDDTFVFPTHQERAKRYVKSMFGPSALLRSAATAGINQWQDSPEEWEQGMSGYGKRFASSFGRNMIQQTVIYGLDSALGWDTGFRRSGKDEFGARLKHALLENITSRTKSGKRVFSVPRVAGAYTSGVISREAWYPERYSWKDGLRAGNNTMLMGFALNVVREFLVNF